MSVYSLVIAREYGKGTRDAQSRNEKKFTLCCQIINSLESVGMEGTRGYGSPWIVKEWWKKGINFILCLGTTYDVSIMESVGMLQVILVGRKSMPLKNNFISQFKL